MTQVGLVTPRYPPNLAGGGETSAALLAEHLVKHDRIEDVTVLSFDGDSVEERNDVHVERLGRVSSTVTEWQNLRAYPALGKRIDSFDLLHAYNMELNPAVGALSARHSIPTVATLNSYHFLPKSVSNATPGTAERIYERVGHPTTGRLMSALINQIDQFIAISSAVRDIYGAHDLNSDRIKVIPNMLDPSFSVPDLEPGEGTTLLYVGELSERKGVGDLIRALKLLPDEYSARVVGDGEEADQFQALVSRLDVADRVTFTGHIPYDEVSEQYARADVFVHPGVWPEPFGRTILEAMQAGLPVVCTDVGGPADIVTDPELRCEPSDPEGLATSIERAVSDAENIGKRNAEYATSEFSPSTVVSEIVSLYATLSD
jgi:glycosyltransferase involved in cell wall biosynthesis